MNRYGWLGIVLVLLVGCSNRPFTGNPLPERSLFLFAIESQIAYITEDCIFDATSCAPVKVTDGEVSYFVSAPDGSAIVAVRRASNASNVTTSSRAIVSLHKIGESSWREIATFDNLNEIILAPNRGAVVISGTPKTTTEQAGATDSRIVEEDIYLYQEDQERNLTEELDGTKSGLVWVDDHTLLFELEYGPDEMPCAIYTMDMSTQTLDPLMETNCYSDPVLSPQRDTFIWRDMETLNLTTLDGKTTQVLSEFESQPHHFFWNTDGSQILVIETLPESGWTTQITQVNPATLEKEVIYRQSGLEYAWLVRLKGQDFLLIRELDNWANVAELQLLSLSDRSVIPLTPEMFGQAELPHDVWWHPQP